MAAIRTQVYLTKEQRAALAKRMKREKKTLAQVIRDAIDAYVGRQPSRAEIEAAMAETFGIDPDFSVPPRSEWNRDHLWRSSSSTRTSS